jgi:hypothetical protein
MLVPTDSFITSPSLPVSLSCPDPGNLVVSTRRHAPPIDVYANPIATPGEVIYSESK